MLVKRYDLDMKEENRLLVFDKKEILIILVFMLGLFAGSFIFGVKVGKDYSFSNSSVTEEEVSTLEVLSSKEEEVDEVVDKKISPPTKEVSYDLLKRKIEEELSKSESKLSNQNSLPVKKNESKLKNAENTKSNSVVKSYYKDNLVDSDQTSDEKSEQAIGE